MAASGQKKIVSVTSGSGILSRPVIGGPYDRAEVESDAKTTWDGPLDLVTTDATYEL